MFTTADVRAILAADHHRDQQARQPRPAPPALPPVWASTPVPDGWTYRAITAYRAPELFARGEWIWLADYLGWCKELGANTLRVLGMSALTGYSPQTFPKYYAQLAEFCTQAERQGFWVHLVALRDQAEGSVVWLPFDGARALHLERVIRLVRDGRVFFEFGDQREGDAALLTEGFYALPSARVPSLAWEPEPIGGMSKPGEHAVNAATRHEIGEGWVIHGGFSSLRDGDTSDLQNCLAPKFGNALDCAHAVASIWNAAPPGSAKED